MDNDTRINLAAQKYFAFVGAQFNHLVHESVGKMLGAEQRSVAAVNKPARGHNSWLTRPLAYQKCPRNIYPAGETVLFAINILYRRRIAGRNSEQQQDRECSSHECSTFQKT